MTENSMHYLVKAAVAAGYKLTCGYDGEVDYQGLDADKAIEALEACDQMDLYIELPSGAREWALIINGLEPDEIIADYCALVSGGFIKPTLEQYEIELGQELFK